VWGWGVGIGFVFMWVLVFLQATCIAMGKVLAKFFKEMGFNSSILNYLISNV
jgi:Na+-transporting methylmalonyl-CoA/oxaloacetate decarboxylase gamma subunit